MSVRSAYEWKEEVMGGRSNDWVSEMGEFLDSRRGGVSGGEWCARAE